MSIQSNIGRGAQVTESGIIIGGYAETCIACNAAMSSDGCSNTECLHGRPAYAIQEVLKFKAARRILSCLISE